MTDDGILEPGDVVRATRDGWPSGHFVPKGTLGVVKEMREGIFVEWETTRGFALPSDAFVDIAP